MNNKDHMKLHYWLAAAKLPGIGPITIKKWLGFFKEIHAIFLASHAELNAAGLTSKQIQLLRAVNWEEVQREIAWCEQNNCQIICLDEPDYPALLQQIPDPPLVLFVQGDCRLLSKPQLAIVGSRNPSIMGREIAEQFASSLAKAGVIITSGLALGVDAASHLGAMKVGGKTLAVLGSGLNSIYPPSHQKLAEEIIEQGALISEFMPNDKPMAKNFPRRNRILSGLSLGVLVIEAALKSGSLITANNAIEQGREVFAIPGSIRNPLARGCHQLIRQGAKLVDSVADILEELDALRAFVNHSEIALKTSNLEKIDVESRRLLTKIGYEVTSVDVIIIRSGLTASKVSSMLLQLEILGLVQNVQGGYVRINP